MKGCNVSYLATIVAYIATIVNCLKLIIWKVRDGRMGSVWLLETGNQKLETVLIKIIHQTQVDLVHAFPSEANCGR